MFDIAYMRTAQKEAGYANHALDPGKETYAGISRKFHPYWIGWKMVDQAKRMLDIREPFKTNDAANKYQLRLLNETLKSDEKLQRLVKEFYRMNFWYELKCDKIKNIDIASELYDTAVNCGLQPAALFLQRSLNVLNNCEKRWLDIAEDGAIGPNTCHAANICINKGYKSQLFKMMNILQGYYYYSICRAEKGEEQEIMMMGWLKRVEIIKHDN